MGGMAAQDAIAAGKYVPFFDYSTGTSGTGQQVIKERKDPEEWGIAWQKGNLLNQYIYDPSKDKTSAEAFDKGDFVS